MPSSEDHLPSEFCKRPEEDPYYRIRIGDYRLGLFVEDDTITVVRFLHRRDIYRYFP
ncbi:type II toxin-antitoxin system RelE/ParE family toxin [Candidatus Chloroploca sp. M-50]|uniref:Type II toxin-antitoxin system RelE/ParE family toxin n=1 Tax=Candidatus Chloroploca mongolica TaxID=2528176 RepID=A0ABS4DGY7_9CHLR|nr:type II toxin-antitoxin system RelE/ParE family toxin [Candidatus Chloroploca mongolica]